MPKDYFSSLPTIEYDINDDGDVKLAVDILTRIRKRANIELLGAVFYNYPMRDGDTLEIIADKYYGNPKYHWIVALVNDIYHHTYDVPLSSSNFDRFILDKYGSYERSVGVTKTISDANTYSIANVYSETHAGIQTSTNNVEIVSGTIPAGSTTTIKLLGGSDPFQNIDVGDIVDLFVPSTWNDVDAAEFNKMGYTQPSEVVSKSTRSDGTYALSTNMDSSTYPPFTWQTDGFLNTFGSFGGEVGQGTANTTHLWLDTATPNGPYATNGFIEITSAIGSPGASEINGNTYPIATYNSEYNVISVPAEYAFAANYGDVGGGGFFPWSYRITYGGYHLTSGDTRIEGDDITLRTGIDHFEMDVYSNDGTTLLLEDHFITKNEYIDGDIGFAANKRIVTNNDAENTENDDKRNIILLHANYLQTFLAQFYSLTNRRG